MKSTENNNLIGVKEGGIYFSAVLFAYVIFSVLLAKNIYLRYFPASASIITVTFVCFLLWKKNPLKIVKLKPCKFTHVFLAIVISLLIMIGLGNVNEYFVTFLEKLGLKPLGSITLPSYNVKNFIFVIFAVCIVPPITEEFLFRGIILNSLNSESNLTKILLSGVLFSLFHMSPSQTVYQFAVGVIYAIIALYSNSLLPTIIMHFTNNFLTVILYYYFPSLTMTGTVWVIVSVIASLCLVTLLIFIAKKIKNDKNKKSSILDYVYYLFGIAICVTTWIASL